MFSKNCILNYLKGNGIFLMQNDNAYLPNLTVSIFLYHPVQPRFVCPLISTTNKNRVSLIVRRRSNRGSTESRNWLQCCCPEHYAFVHFNRNFLILDLAVRHDRKIRVLRKLPIFDVPKESWGKIFKAGFFVYWCC